MKIQDNPRFPANLTELIRQLSSLWRDLATQVNGVSEGRLQAAYNAATAVPSTGTYAKGDYIRNCSPSELGTAGSKYVIKGWICVTAGTPGTWVQDRGYTGN